MIWKFLVTGKINLTLVEIGHFAPLTMVLSPLR